MTNLQLLNAAVLNAAVWRRKPGTGNPGGGEPLRRGGSSAAVSPRPKVFTNSGSAEVLIAGREKTKALIRHEGSDRAAFLRNAVEEAGGAVYCFTAAFAMRGGTGVSGSYALAGGGLFPAANTVFTFTRGTVTNNSAGGKGGGTSVGQSSFNRSGGYSYGNRAPGGSDACPGSDGMGSR